MVMCSKLGEKYRVLSRQVKKLRVSDKLIKTNFGQKCAVENRERNTHRKCHQNRTTVKCLELGGKSCGRRCEMSEGAPALELNIACLKLFIHAYNVTVYKFTKKYMNIRLTSNVGHNLTSSVSRATYNVVHLCAF